MKVSKRAAIAAAIVAAGGATIPAALAAQHNPAGGSNTTQCVDGMGNPMDGVITWSPTTLWPPNHKLVPITITDLDNDNDGDTVTISVTSISDNQNPGGIEDPGSGNTGTDWEIGAPGMATDPNPATTTAQVRAERSGTDKFDRVYTINVACTETGGNSATDPAEAGSMMQMGTATLTVRVPHDQGVVKQ